MVVDCKVEIDCVAYKERECLICYPRIALRFMPFLIFARAAQKHHRMLGIIVHAWKHHSCPSIAMTDPHSIFLLVAATVSVVALILLIAVVKLNPFITLFLTSLALAAVTGMPLSTVVHSFEAGVGGTLGHIAIVVALGTMLGKMMAESGARRPDCPYADPPLRRAAHSLGHGGDRPHRRPARIFRGRLSCCSIPIAFTVARRTGTSLILVGLPMVAGLSVVHGLVPPHPAALMAVTIFKADVGRTIFYALLVGIPTAIIAGPLYAQADCAAYPPRRRKSHGRRVRRPRRGAQPARLRPHAVLTILFPVLLMLIGSWADACSHAGHAR